jgi:monoamine oxidase
MTMTRRGLLNAMASLGGAGAAYETLVLLDFLKPPPAMAAGLALPSDAGKGRTVAILGAGVGGLCAAYELDRAGYDVVILEASNRIGGRNLTLRRGDVLKEMHTAAQVCQFDEGLYLNVGPGRIAHHHLHVIDYCRRFGVTLQPYIFTSRANRAHSGHVGNGRTWQMRQLVHDLHGQIAELLSKCVSTQGIDLPLTKTDIEKFQDLLMNFGGLTKSVQAGTTSYSYKNQTGRGGFARSHGVGNKPMVGLSPLKLDEILQSELWNDFIFRDSEIMWQASLLEPTGGMDHFVKAFARQPLTQKSGTIDALVRLNAKVTAIDVGDDRVTVAYDDGGTARTLAANYCISTIPMPIFKNLKTNLPTAYMSAARNLPVEASGKVGWQAERFWETRDQIYGGISWTTDTIRQIWYPSWGFLSQKGMLTGAYMYGKIAEAFNARPVEERLHIAREQGERLHEGFSKYVEHGIAIGWDRMEHFGFAWSDETDPAFGDNAEMLATPQGRFHQAGDQITFWSGWQEGAIISAWEAVKSIDRQTNPTAKRG